MKHREAVVFIRRMSRGGRSLAATANILLIINDHFITE